MKSLWRYWAKAIGEKAGKTNRESDVIAIIRTLIFMSYLITNIVIISGVVRHWNDNNCKVSKSNENEVSSYLL